MSVKYAVIFPGQGSQKVGMGKDLYDQYDFIRDLLIKCDAETGKNLSKIIFEGPQEELNQTKNTQIAIAMTSIALLEVLKFELNKRGYKLTPTACCGHSLGEFSALYYCEVLDLSQIIKLVSRRGELMQNAPSGGMVAVIGEGISDIENLLSEEKYKGKIVIANYNSPAQVVLSGEKQSIETLATEIKALGKKAIILPVSGAFHSHLMEEPSRNFNNIIDNLNLKQDSIIPIYQNCDGEKATDKNLIIQKIKKQMTSSIYWTQTINNVVKDGVSTFIEIGPGNVLSGLVKKINKDVTCVNINDLDSINNFINNYEYAILQKPQPASK